MNLDRFFVVNIVDKLSRMLMLVFAGIILGAVLALAYYNIFSRNINSTLVLITIYCIIFVFYVSFTNAKRKTTKVEVFKDHLSLVFAKKNEISTRRDIKYSDIKMYKISALSENKNSKKDTPSMRVFGFETTIETNDGQTLSFADSKSDGVLIYSPAYVFRMLDVKRYIPEFPLILENFSSKKDPEDFELQFKKYSETGSVMRFFENKKYLFCLLKYSLTVIIIIAAIALIIAHIMYSNLNDTQNAHLLLCASAAILTAIILPMWIIAVSASFFGKKHNRRAQNIIKSIITEE